VTAGIHIMLRKIAHPTGFWVERARELFAGAFARTWPVDGALPIDGDERAEAPRSSAMRNKS